MKQLPAWFGEAREVVEQIRQLPDIDLPEGMEAACLEWTAEAIVDCRDIDRSLAHERRPRRRAKLLAERSAAMQAAIAAGKSLCLHPDETCALCEANQ